MFATGGGSGVTDMKSFHGIQALGIMQALKTGDPTIDTLIAMLLPFVFTKVIHILTTNGKYFTYKYWFPPKKTKTKEYTRTITYRTTQNATNGTIMNYDEDTYNSFLIRAIKLYLHHNKCQRELQHADLELTDVKSMIVCDEDDDALFGGASSVAALRAQRRMLAMQRAAGGVPSNGGGSSTSTASMLRDCTIIASQIKDQWQEVAGTYDGSKVFIKFSDSTSGSGSASDKGNDESGNGGNSNGSNSKNSKSTNDSNSGGGSNNRNIQICFKSHGSSNAIDVFVHTAYQWYMDELKKVEKNDRYLFDFRSIDVNRNRMPTFAKFKLSDNKTFESLFSQQCHALRKTLDQFLTKTGKYAVQGYPYKVTINLF